MENVTLKILQDLGRRVEFEMEGKNYTLRTLSEKLISLTNENTKGFSYGSIHNYLSSTSQTSQKLLNKYYKKLSEIYIFLMEDNNNKLLLENMHLDMFQRSLLNRNILLIIPKVYEDKKFKIDFMRIEIGQSFSESFLVYSNHKFPVQINFYHSKICRIEFGDYIPPLIILFNYKPYSLLISTIVTHVIYADNDLAIRSTKGNIILRSYFGRLDDKMTFKFLIDELWHEELTKALNNVKNAKDVFLEKLIYAFDIYKSIHENGFRDEHRRKSGQ